MANILKMVLPGNEREVARLRPIVDRINGLEARYKEYSDEQLKGVTRDLRERLQGGATLESVVPDAFAAVREAATRTLGMRHYDVQLIGGLVLHQGRIAEMKTGEGKTLVATSPLFTNALTGGGVHLATVNDYLARRDATWMGPIYHALGMTVAILQHDNALLFDPDYDSGDPHWPHIRPIDRQEAYLCDILYSTNSELAFDYLRDNMVWNKEDCVQRGHPFVIVDEVDSILIDEARTPHIISGEGVGDTALYERVDKIVAMLREEEDFTVEEKQKTAMLTEDGTHRCEKLLGVGNLADPEMHEMMHHVQASLKARYCFKRDVDYVVKDGEVIIVDEFTGRMMPGRRWSDGLHQAVEAKEGVKVEQENKTIATITIQNFFRLYKKIGGMTGTAKTEEGEFRKIYGLDVVQIPTNVPVTRIDYPDIVFKSEEMKYRGMAEELLRYHVRKQPVLVGTRSIAISERVSRRLMPEKLQMLAAISLMRERIESDKSIDADARRELHSVLNRRFHDPLDDYLAQARVQALISMGQNPSEEEIEELQDKTPRLKGLRDLASIASKLQPKFNLNLLDDQNVTDFANFLGAGEYREQVAECLANGVPHQILNAKFHEKEAAIIAEAGRMGAITIATNMAGRGVDILLGGPDKDAQAERNAVKELGGLHILGSERHESRRIDNQLRGRAGRQGDQGSSRYFVSLEDELWRLFGDRTKSFGMQWWDEWLPIDSRLVSVMIERTQKKVELHHFDIRKHTLQYDEVLNDQRTIIYRERRKILDGADLRSNVMDYVRDILSDEVEQYCSTEVHQEEWNYEGLWNALNQIYPLVYYANSHTQLESMQRAELIEFLVESAVKEYDEKESEIGEEVMRDVERSYALQFLTSKWMDHLDAMEYLREGIHLRGYGQIEPVLAYRKEGENYFRQLVASWKRDLVTALFHTQIQAVQEQVAVAPPQRPMRMVTNISGEDGHDPVTEMAQGIPAAAGSGGGGGAQLPPDARTTRNDRPTSNGAGSAPRVDAGPRVGRNELCPCGSGKKYKKCCMLLDTGGRA